ncbi:uncharacterized protein LOC144908296 [Branchiostoma floridae x Branchiostoma belcheri]
MAVFQLCCAFAICSVFGIAAQPGNTAGQCRDPGVPTNGNRDNNSNFTSGQTVRYTCMDGYQLRGTANITCQPNATWSGAAPTCGDIDECATDSDGCDQICTNVLGSYICSCRPGFALKADGHGCVDINECATDSGGCGQTCTNLLGSYNCSCRQGFVLMKDGRSCEVCGHCQGGDVNCDPISGVCSAGCQAGWKTQRCTQGTYGVQSSN